MTFNISPSVQFSEHDFTISVEASAATMIGGVIDSTRGEAYTIKNIPNERVMIENFNRPTDVNYERWFPNYKVLDYTSSLYLVRAIIRKETVTDSVTGKRYSGTKPTTNAQLGVFQNDGKKYPNVKLTFDGLKDSINPYRVLGEQFRVFDYISLTQYVPAAPEFTEQEYRQYFYDNNTEAPALYLDTLIDNDGSPSSVYLSEVKNKVFTVKYDIDGTIEKELFNIKVVDRNNFMIIQTNQTSPKEGLMDLAWNEVGPLGSYRPTNKEDVTANFMKLYEAGTSNLVGILPVNYEIVPLHTGNLYINKYVHVELDYSIAMDLQSVSNGDIFRLSDGTTVKDCFGVVVNSHDDTIGTLTVKLAIVESTYGTDTWDNPTHRKWQLYRSGTTAAQNIHNPETGTAAGYIDPDIWVGNYYTNYDPDTDIVTVPYSGEQDQHLPIFNFSPGFKGEFMETINQNTNEMEIKFFTPNRESTYTDSAGLTYIDGRILNQFDWFQQPWIDDQPLPEDSMLTPQVYTDFNADLFTSRPTYAVLEDTIKEGEFDINSVYPDFLISEATEFVPLYPKFNNEFPYVEREYFDDFTGKFYYEVDPETNQELQIYNFDDFKIQKEGIIFEAPNEALRFVSRWPGSEGNNVYIATCSKETYEKSSIWEGLMFKDIFEYGPKQWDEILIAVIFEDNGEFQIVEQFFASLKYKRKDETGRSIWIEDVINEQSSYIYVTANHTLMGIKDWYRDPLTKQIDPDINPNVHKMPYELSTVTHYENRFEKANFILPHTDEVKKYNQRVDSSGEPLTDEAGNPIPPELLSFLCDSTGKAIKTNFEIFSFNTMYSISAKEKDRTSPIDYELVEDDISSLNITDIEINAMGEPVIHSLDINGNPIQLTYEEILEYLENKTSPSIGNADDYEIKFTNMEDIATIPNSTDLSPYFYENVSGIKIGYDPLNDEVEVDGLMISGPFTSNLNYKGWIEEIDGFYPDSNVFFENFSRMFEGSDGIREDGVVGIPTIGDVLAAYDLYAEPDKIDINILISGGWSNQVVDIYIDNIVRKRRDCISILGTDKSVIYGKKVSKATEDSVKWRFSTTNGVGSISSTYSMLISNLGYIFDKFNDKYRWIDLTGDIAGLAAVTDKERAPWWAFAGYNRGRLRNIIRLSYNPNINYRDELVKAQINPIFNDPGNGILILDERCLTSKNTLFARMHVRRLFIYIEKRIVDQAKYFLFEFNDAITRSYFVSLVEPILSEVKSGRGLDESEDPVVVCDLSNNPAEVREKEQMFCDIYIKPVNVIRHIGLNMIAVKSSISFSEIEL